MTEQSASPAPPAKWAVAAVSPVFFVTVFASAALIFLVEPMIAKMVLPTLGGSPMVWNTCMAFFQAALLVGYAYAHLLQRVKSLKLQVLVHALVLFASALVLPLEVSQIMGAEPGEGVSPGLWLVGVLALSLGPPFAALTATAPLAQAWYARVHSGEGERVNPYVLYAASNLGSLIALLAYPTIVEPMLSLNVQTVGWSLAYVLFVLIMMGAAYTASKSGAQTPLPEVVEEEELPKTITWMDRIIWIGLAAAPSSLMLGVTTHMTTDIASAPFLWVAPLALYLITFVLAFANKPPIDDWYTQIFQAAFVIVAAFTIGMQLGGSGLLMQVFLHILAFFFTALMCHSALAKRRPHPSKLTEFYLLLSIGGVLGGGFNAFLAPVLFNGIWEYPLVLVLAALARPWGPENWKRWEGIVTAIGAAAFVILLWIAALGNMLPPIIRNLPETTIFDVGGLFGQDTGLPPLTVNHLLLAIGIVSIFLIRNRALIFTALLATLLIVTSGIEPRSHILLQDRSFFGVIKATNQPVPRLSSEVHFLAHGTTLHGAQARNSEFECAPLVYYSNPTPIGQVFTQTQTARDSIDIGAVGMGAGTVAAYVRDSDRLRFYEIDQQVIDIAADPEYFTYINGCANGSVDWVLGDARLSLEEEQGNAYDILLVDAFSSDAVPAHLLTREAIEVYLNAVKEDGIVIMHLSNRHLDLATPVAATAEAAGGFALHQYHYPDPSLPQFMDTGEEAIIIARNPAALAPYVAMTNVDGEALWSDASLLDPVRPWTDDYTNIFNAMLRALQR